MEFWTKARLGSGRADDGDDSGTTYLLGGVVVELHVSCRWPRILGASPALHAVRPVALASTVITLGVTPLPEDIAEESLWLAPCACRHQCLLPCRRLVVEFLVVPVCSYVLLAMVSSATIDLAVVVWLS